MKYFKCDFCESSVVEPGVILHGIVGASGGVLLPEKFHEKHFCKPECFWKWVEKFKKEKITAIAERVMKEFK